VILRLIGNNVLSSNTIYKFALWQENHQKVNH
jgi:hypothetical protein